MEPASIQLNSPRGRGSLEDPEVLENVPGHVIPIIEREFDDFDNEAKKFLDGGTPENEFIGFRLKQGVYGQRQPDVQMVRVKLPFGGVTPDQLDAFADVDREVRAAEQGPHHHAAEHPGAPHPAARRGEVHPRAQRLGPLQPRGVRQHGAQRDRRPVGRRLRPTSSSTHALRGAYVRYFVRHPTTQLMPRKVKTAFEGAAEDRSLTGIHDIAFIARSATAFRASRSASAAARRSCRASRRRSTTSSGRQRRLPQGRRGGLPHLRPPGLAARQPRPRPHQGLRRQVRHRRAAPAGRRGARGRLGRRARLHVDARASHDEEADAPAARPTTARPTATTARSSASAPPTSPPSARRASAPSRSRSPAAT